MHFHMRRHPSPTLVYYASFISLAMVTLQVPLSQVLPYLAYSVHTLLSDPYVLHFCCTMWSGEEEVQQETAITGDRTRARQQGD